MVRKPARLSGQICTHAKRVAVLLDPFAEEKSGDGRGADSALPSLKADFTDSTGWHKISEADTFVESFFCSFTPIAQAGARKRRLPLAFNVWLLKSQ